MPGGGTLEIIYLPPESGIMTNASPTFFQLRVIADIKEAVSKAIRVLFTDNSPGASFGDSISMKPM